MLRNQLSPKTQSPSTTDTLAAITRVKEGANDKSFRDLTQSNVRKVLRYQPPNAATSLYERAVEWRDRLVADSKLNRGIAPQLLGEKDGDEQKASETSPRRKVHAGQRLVVQSSLEGGDISGIRKAKGALARPPIPRSYMRRSKLGISSVEL
ncbi:hypothetical protein SISSUDRAFT_494901 [Sistotremastrum suecicum HHB10207 ss-3]|uniref:Uncharacterized protein n=1 Tax=Sistotremastrum suecicum HHB10207 ss-3 TaxID=1314776 RepID=A0A166IHQ8_9AGAM|nr:hypothetical protein SISSUDRAFT_494901 [Sistotremastrum suecicum HHB10207 ss-3]